MPMSNVSANDKSTDAAPNALQRPVVAVTLTCFNRKQTTLRCLRTLHEQSGQDNYRLACFLTDDASTDGTSDAVKAEFPQVHILPGTGDLFWGGGMHLAMAAAMELKPDFVLWLNDDVILKPDALARLLAAYHDLSGETGTTDL